MQTASKKVITGWAMYDGANSVYSLVITSSIFPAYYEAVTSGKKSFFLDVFLTSLPHYMLMLLHFLF